MRGPLTADFEKLLIYDCEEKKKRKSTALIGFIHEINVEHCLMLKSKFAYLWMEWKFEIHFVSDIY